jgi:hypothetical protein
MDLFGHGNKGKRQFCLIRPFNNGLRLVPFHVCHCGTASFPFAECRLTPEHSAYHLMAYYTKIDSGMQSRFMHQNLLY